MNCAKAPCRACLTTNYGTRCKPLRDGLNGPAPKGATLAVPSRFFISPAYPGAFNEGKDTQNQCAF
jgi:hypothetical protein